MKERPILFGAPMVRAIIDGRKTQTRRVVKGMALDWLQPGMFTPEYVALPGNSFSRYGYAGDRLWVREAWCRFPANSPDGMGEHIYYRAEQTGAEECADVMKRNGVHWKPSIHMPRAVSRILLEVTGVRIERLQEISEADARAEGVGDIAVTVRGHDIPAADLAYALLWEDINGPGSWEANPWVWVIEFKRVQP